MYAVLRIVGYRLRRIANPMNLSQLNSYFFRCSKKPMNCIHYQSPFKLCRSTFCFALSLLSMCFAFLFWFDPRLASAFLFEANRAYADVERVFLEYAVLLEVLAYFFVQFPRVSTSGARRVLMLLNVEFLGHGSLTSLGFLPRFLPSNRSILSRRYLTSLSKSSTKSSPP